MVDVAPLFARKTTGLLLSDILPKIPKWLRPDEHVRFVCPSKILQCQKREQKYSSLLSFIILIPSFYKFTDFVSALNQSFRLPLVSHNSFYRIWNCRTFLNKHNLNSLLLPLGETSTPKFLIVNASFLILFLWSGARKRTKTRCA